MTLNFILFLIIILLSVYLILTLWFGLRLVNMRDRKIFKTQTRWVKSKSKDQP